MNVIFTVDVEGHVGDDPVEHLIYGKTADGRLCGIDMLMDVLDQYRMKGLFFVDIAEAWDYGENKIANVLKHIKERNHDVGVHIHPDHMADRKRLFLSEYTREEQYQIIKKCTDFYTQVLGTAPLAFRAGKYGANRETLDILAELGYKADFSEFYGQRWCHIDPPVAKVNVQKLDSGIIEIPVTSYRSLDYSFYSRYDKMDCGQIFPEFETLFEKLEENKNDIAVMFAHSFSCINWRRTPNRPKYQKSHKKRLEKQIKYVYEKMSASEILDLQRTIDIYKNKESSEIGEEAIISLKGFKPLFWFFGRVRGLLKSRLDIKYRKM